MYALNTLKLDYYGCATSGLI